MRKLLPLLIALAAIGPAYADTVKSTLDFGPAASDRVAVVGFTCKSCFGAKSVSVNGVDLKRDVSTGGAEVAEIWSAPLPEGSGPLTVTVSSDRTIDDSNTGAAAVMVTRCGRIVIPDVALPALREASAGDVSCGDSVLAISRGSTPFTGTLAPSQHVDTESTTAASWDINHAIPSFSISATSTVSAVAIYR